MDSSRTNILCITKFAMLCTAFFVMLFSSCNSDGKNKIIINIELDKKANLIRLMRQDTSGFTTVETKMDVKSSLNYFRIKADQPGIYTVNINNIKEEFIASPGETVNIFFRDNSIKFTGKNENSPFRKYIDSIKMLEKKADSLAMVFMQAQSTDTFELARNRTGEEFKRIVSQAKQVTINYITSNPRSLGVVKAVNNPLKQAPVLHPVVDFKWHKHVDSLLQANHPGHSQTIWYHKQFLTYKQLHDRASKAVSTIQPGERFTSVRLPGLKSKNISLDPSKSAVTIVYLWNEEPASRQANKRLKLIHEKYKDNGLDVFAIALIEDPQRWSSAIMVDKMWWNNVIDTLGRRSELVSRYKIEELPLHVVLDSKGVVMTSFINSTLLEEFLNNYIKETETKKK